MIEQTMIASMKRRNESNGGPVNRDGWYGEYATCEICGEQRTCTEEFGLVTCQSCHVDFLPAARLL